MSEWNSYKTDELCEFINGFAFKSTDYVDSANDTLEVFRMGYISRGGGFKEDSTPVFVNRAYGKDLSKYLLQEDDIVMAMTDMKNNVAILGNTARIKQGERFVLNQRAGCLRVKRHDLLDAAYLYYYSNWDPHVDYLRSRANSGVQVNLSTSAIKDAELNVPLIEEQRSIAAILEALDDKIDLNRRMNETLEQTARALFQDWFVDFGPTKAKMAGQTAYLGADLWDLFPERLDEAGVPEGWTWQRIEDMIELSYGKALRADDREPGSVPVYGSGGLTGRHNQALVVGPSVVVGRKGTVGSLYWVDEPFFPIDTVFYVVPKAPLTICYYQLQSLGLESMNTDAAVPGLNRSNVYRLLVPYSSNAIEAAFDKYVKSIRQKIRFNLLESETLAKTRDYLLPRLMSGKVCVEPSKTGF